MRPTNTIADLTKRLTVHAEKRLVGATSTCRIFFVVKMDGIVVSETCVLSDSEAKADTFIEEGMTFDEFRDCFYKPRTGRQVLE